MVSRIRDNTYQRVHSVLLIKDGKLVFEEYFDGRHRYQAHPMHSVSKSVTKASPRFLLALLSIKV
jgi:hypothetical protein